MQQDLGIALRAEWTAPGLQLGTELAVVVDLAVKGDDERTIVIFHRLGAGGGEVDNREAAMAQANAAVGGNPIAGAIGAARDHGVADGGQLFVADRFARSVIKDGSDAAHFLSPKSKA